MRQRPDLSHITYRDILREVYDIETLEREADEIRLAKEKEEVQRLRAKRRGTKNQQGEKNAVKSLKKC